MVVSTLPLSRCEDINYYYKVSKKTIPRNKINHSTVLPPLLNIRPPGDVVAADKLFRHLNSGRKSICVALQSAAKIVGTSSNEFM